MNQILSKFQPFEKKTSVMLIMGWYKHATQALLANGLCVEPIHPVLCWWNNRPELQTTQKLFLTNKSTRKMSPWNKTMQVYGLYCCWIIEQH